MACKYKYKDNWYSEEEVLNLLRKENSSFTTLYQSLLKELETGRGKEVFEQVKRDYNIKKQATEKNNDYEYEGYIYTQRGSNFSRYNKSTGVFEETTEEKHLEALNYYYDTNKVKYTLEEQQEEAIVTLLGELAAGKLEEKENASLKKKLLEFWKQISDFVRQLLLQDGIKIDELPISTTLNDLAEIMAYGNNKIILPGYKVEYSTPLGNKYDTLEEVNNEIRGLADTNVEVDLSGVKLRDKKESYKIQNINTGEVVEEFFDETEAEEYLEELKYEDSVNRYKIIYGGGVSDIQNFIEKNKEFEQSKEIIEQWKKENNIQYDPEEVYSRGQEFYHIKDAYFDSAKDTELWVQGLLGILDDYERAGTRMELSFATAPQGEVGKGMRGMPEARRNGTLVYITAYPQSEDIVMASKVDNNTSSFGHLNGLEKAFTNRDNTVTGIALTKSVPLRNLHTIEPNLADTIDDVAHHNESVIALTKNNFRIHYGENVAYEVKQIIDKFNKILDDRYGKLEKPEIKKAEKKQVGYSLILDFNDGEISVIKEFKTEKEANDALIEERKKQTREDLQSGLELKVLPKIEQGKQPTQTKENTTSIESVKSKIDAKKGDFVTIETLSQLAGQVVDEEGYMIVDYGSDYLSKELSEKVFESYKEAENALNEFEKSKPKKEYTSQAETNLKVAALKEVARKYPRSLITSKVVPIDKNLVQSGEVQYSKIPSAKDLQNEISEYLQGMDESIALEYDNLLSSQKQQAIEYYIEKQQNQSQKFSLAEKLEAPCEGGPNI